MINTNRFFNLKNKYVRVFLFLGLVLLVGILFRIFSPPASTVTEGPASDQRSITWKDVKDPLLPTQGPSYSYSSVKFSSALPPAAIASALKFTNAPQVRDSKTNPLAIYSNPAQSLVVNLDTAEIVLSYNDSSLFTNQTGAFPDPDTLTANLTSLIKQFNLYDQKISFTRTKVEYFTIDMAYLNPVPADQASLISITLTPAINDTPLVTANQDLITGKYSRKGQLILLNINHPLSTVTKLEDHQLAPFSELTRRPPSAFFKVNVKPATQADYWLSDQQIKNLEPNAVSLSLFLDPDLKEIRPVFTINRDDSYTYATSAYSFSN